MTTLSKTQLRRRIILISIGALALLFGMWLQFNYNKKPAPPTLVSATIFPQSRIINPFQLTDDEGKPFTLDNFKGHWSIVFFGFTNCPDLCPTTLSTLNDAYKKLVAAKQNPMPQVVFISVDPEADTPDRMKTYLSSFNKAFLGAVGSQEQIDQLTKELSVLYAKIAQKDAHYTIDHSGTILIINPQGQFAGVFSMPHNADNIAHDLQTIIKSAS